MKSVWPIGGALAVALGTSAACGTSVGGSGPSDDAGPGADGGGSAGSSGGTSSGGTGSSGGGHGVCIFDKNSFDDGCVFAASSDQDASVADASPPDAGTDAPTHCNASANDLATRILSDPNVAKTKAICTQVLSGGFTAGSGYPQVWVRDFNTFILPLLDIVDPSIVRAELLDFFDYQGSLVVSVGATAGNIIDGIDVGTTTVFKNTSETDQETSLVQAVTKYVEKTNDKSILAQMVNGRTVLDRMSDALQYLMDNRYSAAYGLLWGATTADWGDNQAEDSPGAWLDYNTHPAIDIYDNAMFVIALQDIISVGGDPNGQWAAILQATQANVRRYLWDGTKFVPHLYLDRGSPFPSSFDERGVLYHGGHAVAMEAGLVSADEAAALFAVMQHDVVLADARTIGLNQYPPYPAGYFVNPVQTLPYTYQNAGDWPWFGGRLVNQAVRLGFPDVAYNALQPMLALFVRDNDINEWYTPAGGAAGSQQFKGGAGVIATAIQALEQWAKAQLASNCE